MKASSLHSLNPASARKKITQAKSNKRFVAALLDRDHREHKEVVEHWTRLHEAAFSKLEFPAAARHGGNAERRTSRSELPVGGALGGNRVRADAAPRRIKAPLQDAGGTGQPEPPITGTGNRPTVNMEAGRIQAIIEDAPARFEIRDNPDANPDYGRRRAIHALGVIAVRFNAAVIEREAEAQGVDPDLVKAILYVERAQGYHDIPAELLGRSQSLHPMNIRPDPWAALTNPPADLADSETNIRTAVTLLRRIAERIDDPTPAKVASIWNFTGRELVNDFGARVQAVYDERTWAFKHDPSQLP